MGEYTSSPRNARGASFSEGPLLLECGGDAGIICRAIGQSGNRDPMLGCAGVPLVIRIPELVGTRVPRATSRAIGGTLPTARLPDCPIARQRPSAPPMHSSRSATLDPAISPPLAK